MTGRDFVEFESLVGDDEWAALALVSFIIPRDELALSAIAPCGRPSTLSARFPFKLSSWSISLTFDRSINSFVHLARESSVTEFRMPFSMQDAEPATALLVVGEPVARTLDQQRSQPEHQLLARGLASAARQLGLVARRLHRQPATAQGAQVRLRGLREGLHEELPLEGAQANAHRLASASVASMSID